MVDYVRERAAEAGLDQVVGIVAEPDSPNLPEPVAVMLIVNTSASSLFTVEKKLSMPALS